MGFQAIDTIGLAAFGVHGGVDEAGADGVDADAFFGDLFGETDGERIDGAFGGGVVDVFAGGAGFGGAGGDVDDGAAGAVVAGGHAADGFFRTEQRGLDVEGEEALNAGGVEGVEACLGFECGGVVDQGGEAAEFGVDLFEEGEDAGFGGEVGLDGDGVDFGGELFGDLAVVGIVDGDFIAAGGGEAGGGGTDAAGAAGDDDDGLAAHIDSLRSGRGKGAILGQMTVGEEYRKRGFLAVSRALADPSVVQELLADEPAFARELARMEAERRRGVPYLLTEAIRRVAQDAAIVATVEAILGTRKWVMWGPNIRRATPNEAHAWHVDLESFLWPTVTVAVGLEGCTAEAATWCIAGTQGRRDWPPTDEAAVLAAGVPEQFAGFGDGRFYVFDASVWHRGDRETSRERVVLFLHYQRAEDKRIPLLLDYYRQLWGAEAAPYFTTADGERVRKDVATFPWRYGVGRLLSRVKA